MISYLRKGCLAIFRICKGEFGRLRALSLSQVVKMSEYRMFLRDQRISRDSTISKVKANLTFFICLFLSISARLAFFSMSCSCFVSLASRASSFSISAFNSPMLSVTVARFASRER